MNLTKYRTTRYPLGLLDELDREISSLFRPRGRFAFRETPLAPIHVSEEEDAYDLRIEVPGVNPKDLEVNVEGRFLRVKGEKKDEKEEKEAKRRHTERRFGRFERSFLLPEDAQGDKIQAEYRHGLLEVRIPKIEKAKPRQIKVRMN